eukprot:751438-Hanusia_phi.AAC.1
MNCLREKLDSPRILLGRAHWAVHSAKLSRLGNLNLKLLAVRVLHGRGELEHPMALRHATRQSDDPMIAASAGPARARPRPAAGPGSRSALIGPCCTNVH